MCIPTAAASWPTAVQFKLKMGVTKTIRHAQSRQAVSRHSVKLPKQRLTQMLRSLPCNSVRGDGADSISVWYTGCHSLSFACIRAPQRSAEHQTLSAGCWQRRMRMAHGHKADLTLMAIDQTLSARTAGVVQADTLNCIILYIYHILARSCTLRVACWASKAPLAPRVRSHSAWQRDSAFR